MMSDDYCLHGGPVANCVDPDAPTIHPANAWLICACGGPCEHDGSLARAKRFDRAMAAEIDTAAPLAEFSPQERARLEAIEAAEPAPESWAIVRQVRAALEDVATDLEWAATKQDRPDVALGFTAAAARIREQLDGEQ